MTETPRANRLHIGIFGKRNSGKSSLINALTGFETAIVSDHAGTTADPVYKSIEIHPIGPCVLIDTAGFDDEGELGRLRVEKTKAAADKTDIALVIFSDGEVSEYEIEWICKLREKKTPVITVLNKSDLLCDSKAAEDFIEQATGIKPVTVSARTKSGIEQIISELIRQMPAEYDSKTITGGIVNDGDTVMLVMPQDIQAPKGRLILPQVQTLRELLDRKCIVLSSTADKLSQALAALKQPPDVIITDSQVFKAVYAAKPRKSKLTSFSVLFAACKGDIDYYAQSAKAIDRLDQSSKVLIAEACTHAPLEEDIGREKLPRLLREKCGSKLQIDIVNGTDFPADLSAYDLVIHCGACMFNRKYVLSRTELAKKQQVPMTNYGVALAHLSGILDKIDIK